MDEEPLTTGHFVAPVRPLHVTSDYGPRVLPRGRDFHEGTDLRARTPVPVHAMDGGVVLFAGSHPRSTNPPAVGRPDCAPALGIA